MHNKLCLSKLQFKGQCYLEVYRKNSCIKFFILILSNKLSNIFCSSYSPKGVYLCLYTQYKCHEDTLRCIIDVNTGFSFINFISFVFQHHTISLWWPHYHLSSKNKHPSSKLFTLQYIALQSAMIYIYISILLTLMKFKEFFFSM